MRELLLKNLRTLIVKDDTKLVEYVDFCLNNTKDMYLDCELQAHHILLKSVFKEFRDLKKNKWNCAHLSFEDHVKAHKLLAQAIHNDSVYNANWYMSQQTKIIKDDLYYETIEVKRRISSETNTGFVVAKRKGTTECFRISKEEFDKNNDLVGSTFGSANINWKGTILVQNEHGEKFRIKKEDFNPEIHYGCTKGLAVYKNIFNGEVKMLKTNDEFVLNGTFIGIRCGKLTEEEKLKIKNSKKHSEKSPIYAIFNQMNEPIFYFESNLKYSCLKNNLPVQLFVESFKNNSKIEEGEFKHWFVRKMKLIKINEQLNII